MNSEGLIYLLIFVAAGIILWIYIKKRMEQDKATKGVWHTFAGMKGLQEGKPENPSDLIFYGKNQRFPFILKRVMIKGKPGGRVRLFGQDITFRRGDTYHTYTQMNMQLFDLPKGLRICSDTLLRRMSKTLGAQDIRTGDQELDESAVIKGADPEEVRLYLTAERCSALKKYLKELELIEVREDGLHLERKGLIKEIGELERLHSLMGAFALSLSKPRPNTPSPSVSEGVTKTQPKGRQRVGPLNFVMGVVMGVVIALLFGGVSSFGVYVTYKDINLHQRLKTEGAIAIGKVLDKNTNSGERTEYHLNYLLEIASLKITNRVKVEPHLWDRFKKDDPIRIIYVPGKPEINLPEGVQLSSDKWVIFGFCSFVSLACAVMLIGMVAKLLKGGYREKKLLVAEEFEEGSEE
jgi:hypothetical protein